MRSFSLLVLLLSGGAIAGPLAGRSASLLAGVELSSLGGAATAAQVVPAALPEVATPAVEAKSSRVGFGELYVKTAAIGMASSATGVLLGAGFGSLSNSLLGAVLPGALINLFFAPVVTAIAAMLIGNADGEMRFNFGWPFLGTVVANAALYVITSLALPLAVAWTNAGALLLYALIDGLLMSGAGVGMMALTEKKEAVPVITSFVPGVSNTSFVSLSTVEF